MLSGFSVFVWFGREKHPPYQTHLLPQKSSKNSLSSSQSLSCKLSSWSSSSSSCGLIIIYHLFHTDGGAIRDCFDIFFSLDSPIILWAFSLLVSKNLSTYQASSLLLLINKGDKQILRENTFKQKREQIFLHRRGGGFDQKRGEWTFYVGGDVHVQVMMMLMGRRI